MPTDATSTDAPVAVILSLTSSLDPTSGVTVYTASIDTGGAPTPYWPWPLSVNIFDETASEMLWQGSTGPNDAGSFTFYFTSAGLMMPTPTVPVMLASCDPGHSYSIQAAYAGDPGYQPAVSATVPIS